MNAFDRLAGPVRAWIDQKGWSDFSEIQDVAIPRILDGEGALLVSATASGKTEAAVLPIVSRIIEDRLPPIAMLYIAPLKALINDQVKRVERIISETSLGAAWWHGDLSPSRRREILRRPPHALLTTPESLEVMLSSDAYGHGALLAGVHYVLIDEIHAFAETDRGAQLMSLLARIEALSPQPPARVALSATIAHPQGIVEWMRSPLPGAPAIGALVAEGTKERRIGVGVIPEVGDPKLPRADRERQSLKRLGGILQKHVAGQRSLIFTNSRDRAELITAELLDRGIETHIHHGSVDVSVRQRTEAVFRMDGPKTIVATSTLELGIDIGDLDQSIQLGAPATASSFLQRLGRSGRREDKASVGLIYALDDEELPTCLAVADLAKEGTAEELEPDHTALHVLFHQVIQLVRERDRVSADEVYRILSRSGAFDQIPREHYDDLLRDMLEDSYLELERERLVIGVSAEQQFGALAWRNFYSVFQTEPAWTVKHGLETVGTLSLGHPITERGENLFVLAGRKWRVTAVDRHRCLLLVEPAPQAKIPRWAGDGVPYSFEVMRRTCEILGGLRSPIEHAGLTAKLVPARETAQILGIAPDVAAVDVTPRATMIYTYAGFFANRYLAALLRAALKMPAIASGPAVTVKHEGPSQLQAIVDVTQDILASPQRRDELEAAALAASDPLPVGKYWDKLGARTRTYSAANRLRRDRRQLERLPALSVRLSAALTAIPAEADGELVGS